MHKFVIKRLKDDSRGVRNFGVYHGREKIMHYFSFTARGKREAFCQTYNSAWNHPAYFDLLRHCLTLVKMETPIKRARLTAEYMPGVGYKISAHTI